MAAHRGMENPFSSCTRVGPCAHLSAENRSTDYQSQLTPSQPREGLVGREKAQSNTNKHEDQQMTPSITVSFFLSPSSFTHSHLIPYIVLFLVSFLLNLSSFPLVSSTSLFVPRWLSSECDMSSVRCSSPLPHTVKIAVITLTPCYFTPTVIGGAVNESRVLDFIL